MAAQGKYHGQQLKAEDVLRLYGAGERDFRGTILRGRNFCGANLSGADFSGADIRSARFVNATLTGVKFCGVQGGLQQIWVCGQLWLVIVVSALGGFLQAAIRAMLEENLELTTLITFDTGASIFLIVVVFLTLAHQGFTLGTLGSNAVATVVIPAFAILFRIEGLTFGAVSTTAGIAAFNGAITFMVAFMVVFTGIGARAFAVTGATVFAIVGVVTGIFTTAYASNAVFTCMIAGASYLLSVYINRCIHHNNPKFENLRIIGLTFSALGGTSFSGADLTNAYFTKAILKGVNFVNSRQQSTVLHHVRWHQAIQLDRARLGSVNLRDPRVCKLLTTLNGNNENLSHVDLGEVNLAEAQLRNANLCWAKLSGANFYNAQLYQANFTAAQCTGTDFTAAQLTGACLDAWNIDDTTVLKDVDCQFVYLKEHPDHLGSRERLPHNPDKIFAPGDFEKYFCEVMDEVKLLMRGGVDPQAFKTAFQALMDNHRIEPANVRGFERQGTDVMIRVAVPTEQTKADIARTFDTHYEKALPVSTVQQLIAAERQSKQDIIQLANKSIDSISAVLSNLTINTTAMTNSNNPNVSDGSLYAGGDVNLTGSNFNLGQISGQVSNQINQLPDSLSEQSSLKDLLTQLQTAINQDTELSDAEKAEALGEVAKLAKAGSAPKEGKMQNLAKRATATLKAIAGTLNDSSQLAIACQTLLPMVMALF